MSEFILLIEILNLIVKQHVTLRIGANDARGSLSDSWPNYLTDDVPGVIDSI